jgi:hypothetical protein
VKVSELTDDRDMDTNYSADVLNETFEDVQNQNEDDHINQEQQENDDEEDKKTEISECVSEISHDDCSQGNDHENDPQPSPNVLRCENHQPSNEPEVHFQHANLCTVDDPVVSHELEEALKISIQEFITKFFMFNEHVQHLAQNPSQIFPTTRP